MPRVVDFLSLLPSGMVCSRSWVTSLGLTELTPSLGRWNYFSVLRGGDSPIVWVVSPNLIAGRVTEIISSVGCTLLILFCVCYSSSLNCIFYCSRLTIVLRRNVNFLSIVWNDFLPRFISWVLSMLFFASGSEGDYFLFSICW